MLVVPFAREHVLVPSAARKCKLCRNFFKAVSIDQVLLIPCVFSELLEETVVPGRQILVGTVFPYQPGLQSGS